MRNRILAGIMALSLLIFAAGCAGPKPEESVKACLDAMIKADYTKAAEYINGGAAEDMLQAPEGDEEAGAALIEALLGRISYELGESKVSGDSATVAAKVTAPDMMTITGKVMMEAMGAAFAMAFSDAGSEDAINDMFMNAYQEAIETTDAPMKTTNVTINLTKSGAKWLINSDDSLGDALTGGMITAWEQMEGK